MTSTAQKIADAIYLQKYAEKMQPNVWREYDDAAEWCAERGIKGKHGDALPALLSTRCLAEINADPEAFEQRVRDSAYAIAMRKRGIIYLTPTGIKGIVDSVVPSIT